ncbi:hypothetical protein TNCV_294311 [Trichonephila clavipes]|nr:hypothetical protein TNCV_294311 [Trichonephila clavipes]
MRSGAPAPSIQHLSIGAAICWLLEAAFAYDRFAFAFFEVKVLGDLIPIFGRSSFFLFLSLGRPGSYASLPCGRQRHN